MPMYPHQHYTIKRLIVIVQCGQTPLTIGLTIDHILMKCAVLQESRDEYYTADSLNALFKTF